MVIQDFAFKEFVKNKEAFSELEQLGLPSRKMEDYRHINCKELFAQDYALATSADGVSQSDFCQSFVDEGFYTLIVANGAIDEKKSNLPSGLTIQSAPKGNTKGKEENPLSLLGLALSQNHYAFQITKNLDKPLLVIYTFSNTDAFYAHQIDVEIAEGVQAKIVDVMAFANETQSYAVINKDFTVHKNAHLQYYKTGNTSDTNSTHINYEYHLLGGKLEAFYIENGLKQSVNNINVQIDAENSEVDLFGVATLDKHQLTANTIKMCHNVKQASSNQNFKHILDGNSHAIFNSKIVVEKNCSQTIAHQNTNTILQSDDARIFNEPRMMIFTDELEASHGASVGSLSEDALNYMALRGLSKTQAEKMLLQAFKSEIIETIEDKQIREYIMNIK